MNSKEDCHYIDSIIYAMEHTVVYCKVKGSQIFTELDLGITSDQFTTLDAIYSSKDICQRDLSKLILKDRSNTGRLLNILEEKGLIERFVETKNNRLVKMIYITEQGKKLIEENQPNIRNAFLQAFSDVSDEEIENLRKTLDKLKTGLSKITTMQI